MSDVICCVLRGVGCVVLGVLPAGECSFFAVDPLVATLGC
jgi:hypothetical protein